MAYSVYPYPRRDMRAIPMPPEEMFEAHKEPKRGDLEGYVAAKDFASHAYSSCMYSQAQVNIRQLNNLRNDMTAKEYMNILIKQGQVPEKHFKYQRGEDYEVITELNGYRDMVKRIIFAPMDKEAPVVSKYYNPDTGEVFKEVSYLSDGKICTKMFYYSEDGVLTEKTITEPQNVQRNASVPINKPENPFSKLQYS